MPTTSTKHFGIPNRNRSLTDEQIAYGNQMRSEGAKYKEIALALGCTVETAQVYCGESQNASKTGYGEIFDHRNEYLCLLSPETRASLDRHYNNTRK